MRALLDTCVLIDGLQGREPFRKDSEKIFLAAANEVFTGCITAKALTDIYYLMHRFNHSDKDSRTILEKLLSLFELLDTTGIDCQKALISSTSDYEDALMVETAIRSRVDCLVTRNEGDFKNYPIPIYSPKEFLKQIV
ncbi:MAG: PIN domain-containing protein [Bacillota bacterium]|nr:PIN domain-containing protein [Bacillota bacterium]